MQKPETLLSATEFKKHFLSLVDEVKNKHNSFVITKRKIPIAKIVPLDHVPIEKPKSLFGFMQGSVKINDDIINYNSDTEWEMNNE